MDNRCKRFSLFALVIVTCWLASCAQYHRNARLQTYDPNAGYRYPTPDETANQDELFIALAFSGGGTRAAALNQPLLLESGVPGKNIKGVRKNDK